MALSCCDPGEYFDCDCPLVMATCNLGNSFLILLVLSSSLGADVSSSLLAEGPPRVDEREWDGLARRVPGILRRIGSTFIGGKFNASPGGGGVAKLPGNV